MVTVMPDSDDQQIDKTSIDDNTEDQENKIEHEVRYIKNNGYDYNNLYGLLAVPFLGIVLSVLTYLLRKYQCHGILRVIKLLFLNNSDVNDDEDNDSYGSHSTATPPIILYPKDFSDYNTSQTSSYATIQYSDKEIQTSLPSIDLEKKFDSSDTGSRGTSLDEKDSFALTLRNQI